MEVRRIAKSRASIGIAASALLLCVGVSSEDAAASKRGARVQAVTTSSLGVGAQPANYDVSCPRGLKAVGGGFSTFGIGTSGPSGGSVTVVVPVIMESRRLNDRTWRITEKAALNPAAGPSSPRGTTVTASVYCRKVKGRVRAVEVVGAVSTSNSTPSSADPKCPRGQVALAGGFSVTAPDSGFVYPSVFESFRDGQRGWRSSAIPNTQSSTGLLGFVYCSHESRPPRAMRRNRGYPGITSVRCGKGSAAAAGGFQSAPGEGLGLSTGSIGGKKPSYPPLSAYPAGTSWIFRGAAGTTVFAYCS
jgi:hypothetical protein